MHDKKYSFPFSFYPLVRDQNETKQKKIFVMELRGFKQGGKQLPFNMDSAKLVDKFFPMKMK
ncbi:hypothetical protein DERP_005541 [Dermatophagoides pteronyssinus]|uniref:Uncharacterized protein n=1 Tax=Dermatophagoides pteronyssinus TaxID=6956 RepID=A0ABQ8JNS1_DERPT|nr:hypothetical protein DERP_005541 [Dermatophagoides pteronyssinus]